MVSSFSESFDKMPAAGFHPGNHFFCFIRLPVAQVNEGGDRRGIGKGQLAIRTSAKVE